MAKKKRRSSSARPVPPAEDAGLSAEERAARREQQKREWAEQKRAEERAANRSFAPLYWAGGVIVTLAIIIPVVLLVAGGGGGDDATATPIATLDPRLGSAQPVSTLTIFADDSGQNIASRFEPNTLTAKAGEVFEVQITNNGTVHHNLTIDGGDGDFGSDDDWISNPFSFDAGETATLRAKFNEAGVYQFECVLHAGVQTGTLTVIPNVAASASSTATPSPTSSGTPAP